MKALDCELLPRASDALESGCMPLRCLGLLAPARFELAADVLATPEGAESLGEARFYLRGCLGTLLRRGEGESRSTALDYLRQLARTARTSGARRQFLDVHAAHADPQVHRQFLIELGL